MIMIFLCFFFVCVCVSVWQHRILTRWLCEIAEAGKKVSRSEETDEAGVLKLILGDLPYSN